MAFSGCAILFRKRAKIFARKTRSRRRDDFCDARVERPTVWGGLRIWCPWLWLRRTATRAESNVGRVTYQPIEWRTGRTITIMTTNERDDDSRPRLWFSTSDRWLIYDQTLVGRGALSHYLSPLLGRLVILGWIELLEKNDRTRIGNLLNLLTNVSRLFHTHDYALLTTISFYSLLFGVRFRFYLVFFFSIFFFLFSCFRAVLPNFASPPDWKSVVCVVCLPFADSVDCHLVANSSANRFAGKQIEKMLLCLFHTRSNATILVGISARLSIGSIQSNLMIDFAFERKRDANITKNKRIYCRFSFKRISHEDEFPWFLFLITNFELMVFCFFVIFVTTHENWKAIRMRYPITKCFERGACMETGWFGLVVCVCLIVLRCERTTIWQFQIERFFDVSFWTAFTWRRPFRWEPCFFIGLKGVLSFDGVFGVEINWRIFSGEKSIIIVGFLWFFWRKIASVIIQSVRKAIEMALENNGESFEEAPTWWDTNFLQLNQSTIKRSPSNTIQNYTATAQYVIRMRNNYDSLLRTFWQRQSEFDRFLNKLSNHCVLLKSYPPKENPRN